MTALSRRIQVIDSHTGGEPTRVVIEGGPDLGSGTIQEKLRLFREHHDVFRSSVVNEPRGSDVMVGALLVPPCDPSCSAAVIFFNNVGYLGMCGHGTIGLIVTLAHLGRIQPGDHRIETSVGIVTATLHASGEVSVRNVASYRAAICRDLSVEGIGIITGEIAWGGNWFFLTSDISIPLLPINVAKLTEVAQRIRNAVVEHSGSGAIGKNVDHIELCGPPMDARNHSRNFMLCPGGAYDRSPCGTGTSAKLACLYANGKLQPGEVWRQEGILGTVFEGSVAIEEGHIIPTIRGSAFITGESTLILYQDDPFRNGIR